MVRTCLSLSLALTSMCPFLAVLLGSTPSAMFRANRIGIELQRAQGSEFTWRVSCYARPCEGRRSSGYQRSQESFWIALDKGKTILLAGGIGITPIISMADHLSLEMADFELHYGARSRSSMAFFDQLSTSNFTDKIRLYFDDDAVSGRMDSRSILASKDDGSHVYICGPKGFVDHHLDVARQLGWTESQLHREHFSATAPVTASSDSFELVLAKSAKSFTIPSGKRVIDVLWDNGFEIPVSCEQGVCGVLPYPVRRKGVPEHRDSFLTDEERAKWPIINLPLAVRAR